MEIFEPRMMLHGDAMVGHDAIAEMDDASLDSAIADMTDGSTGHSHSDITTSDKSLTEIPANVAVPTVSVSATNNYKGGVNVSVNLSNFTVVAADSTDLVIVDAKRQYTFQL